MLSFRHYWLVFKRKILSYPIAYISKYSLRLILSTCRIQIKGLERFVEIASKEKCIVMLWHNRLAILAEILNNNAAQFNYSAVISKSRDGEPLALLANSYKAGKAIRVPHRAKHQALKMVIDSLNTTEDIILFTPDGPRGPQYRVKPGIALAAKETGAVIIPFSWNSNNVWKLRTWDQFMLPKPFTTLTVDFGEPINLDPAQSIERSIFFLETRLNS